MNIDEIKKYCMAKRGVTETYPFDDITLVYKVGSKMFVLVNTLDKELSISLKCEPLLAVDLRREFTGITPGYHLNKTHWNTVMIDGSVPDDKIMWLIDLSYDLVFKGLKKVEQKMIAQGEL